VGHLLKGGSPGAKGGSPGALECVHPLLIQVDLKIFHLLMGMALFGVSHSLRRHPPGDTPSEGNRVIGKQHTWGEPLFKE